MNLQLDSVESDSFNVTTPTDDSQERVSPLQGTDELDETASFQASFQAEADRCLQFTATPEDLSKVRRCPNTSNGVRGIPPDEIEVLGVPGAECADISKDSCDSAQIGVDVTESVGAEASPYKSIGRVARNLARTKCLKWLGSLDEGE